MLTKNFQMLLLAAGAITLTFGTLDLVSLPSHNRLWREVANSGHIPLFGLLSLVILRLSVFFLKSRFTRWYAHYLVALVVVTAIGVMSELLQMSGPRDADPYDLIRDVVGAIVFLSLISTIPRRILPWTLVDWSQKAGRLLRLAALLLLMSSLWPVFYWSAAFYERQQQFPLICGFESIWEMAFVGADSGKIERVDPPPGWESDSTYSQGNNRVGRYTFALGRHPGFHIKEPYPDFSGYETLIFDLFSKSDRTHSLVVRIDDRHHNNEYNDRFNLEIFIQPGMNRIEIPCSKIRFAPINREMDMTAIAVILFFALQPAEPFTIFVDNIHLR